MNSSAPFAHPLLRAATPAAWLDAARRSQDVLLIDHANCEKKAASTALSLMFAYAQDLKLADRMSRLAREELRHYEQVAKVIRSVHLKPARLSPGRYASRLRSLVAKSEPQREVDLLICGAFIEARSCERFAALAEDIDAPLRELYRGLHAAEARHYRVYLNLARHAARRAGIAWERRAEEFAVLEAQLIVLPDDLFRFHSGPPASATAPTHGPAHP